MLDFPSIPQPSHLPLKVLVVLIQARGYRHPHFPSPILKHLTGKGSDPESLPGGLLSKSTPDIKCPPLDPLGSQRLRQGLGCCGLTLEVIPGGWSGGLEKDDR